MGENEDIGITLDPSKSHLHIGEFSDNFSELYFNLMTDNLDLVFSNECPNDYVFSPRTRARAQAELQMILCGSHQLQRTSVRIHASHQPVRPPCRWFVLLQKREKLLPSKRIKASLLDASTLQPTLSV